MTQASGVNGPPQAPRDSSEDESALILLVPEAEALVGELRAAHDPAAEAGVPAHVTINYPFRPADSDPKAVQAKLRRLMAPQPAFQLRFEKIGRFPTVIYLAPEPVEPLLSLIELVSAAFPESPPYEGVFDRIVPHLTVADVQEPADLDRIETRLKDRLATLPPVESEIDAVWLLQNSGDGWRQVEPFPLLGAADHATR